MGENRQTHKKRVVNMNDRRVRKTVKTLRETLIKLLNEKSINDITVSELTALADVNRSTFYFYYDDISDMVQQIQNEIYSIFYETVIIQSGELVSVEDYLNYIARFFEFCKDNETICKFLINNDINSNLFVKIMADVRSQIPDSSKEFSKDRPEYYLTNYIISGITGIIKQWLDDGMLVEPKEMARFIGVTYMLGVVKTLDIKLDQEEATTF